MLKKGCDAAREVAAATLDDVRKAMKINYFDDAELIAEQVKEIQRRIKKQYPLLRVTPWPPVESTREQGVPF